MPHLRAPDRLSRRVVLAGALAFWAPPCAGAQEPGRVYRVGGLFSFPLSDPGQVAWVDGIRRLGFVEGKNLLLDRRGWDVRPEQFPPIAAALAKAALDAIAAGGDPAIRAAQRATATIPILGFTDDMVGSGLVHSMAHPGGNTTGISLLAADLDGKRQEILTEIVPDARHIAALADAATTTPRRLRALANAAQARGIELSVFQVAKAEEIERAISAAQATGAAALNVLASPLLYARRRQIIERAAALRLPAMYQWPETADEGGLAGYGPRILQLFRDAFPRQLAKLLNGANPADLPVEQPTKFELVINLETAKALDLTVPPSILARADEVIE